MAGLYIHVPFCTKRCLYCDFFSNTNMNYKAEYISALIKEIELRREYIDKETIETIYFGGGTPSQLQARDFEIIFDTIHKYYSLSPNAEITLEANPDDITSTYIESIRPLPFNRISMGVQSFKNSDLHFLNRRHNRQQALDAVILCKQHGFSNISIDLIYGLPGQSLEDWQYNLDEVIQLEIPHISAYHIIYEEGTALYKLMKEGKIHPVNEDLSLRLFTQLIRKLNSAGYIHYEISNFSKPEMFSRHNCSYWTGKKYLGVGPSAHSYNGKNRQWNISSLPLWIKGITSGKPEIEIETLDLHTRYNDFIITGLRTMWGIRLSTLEKYFGKEMLDYCLWQAQSYIKDNLLIYSDNNLKLSPKGIFISDGIMSDLLFV